MQLFTIGYEGHTPESFGNLLRGNQVEVLLDVRQRAGSRKPSFSKTRLREMLAEHGIDYRHLPLLGTPADLRAKYKAGELDRDLYLDAYREHLAEQLEKMARTAKHSSPSTGVTNDRIRGEAANSLTVGQIARRFRTP